MKKQILFLAMFTLALIFAGTNNVFGQDPNFIPATACAPVTPLLCATDNALTPLPGKTYTYTIGVSPTVSTGNIQWFVYNATSATSIITGGSIATAVAAAEKNDGTSKYLLSATATKYNAVSGNIGAAGSTIDISWQSFDGSANKILLIAYVKGEGGCSDEIQAYQIVPNFAFTLDIAGLTTAGALPASGNANECISPVQSATYTAGNPGTMAMDYGENYVYFTVTAANFVNKWKPTFTITPNNLTTVAALTTAAVEWAYPLEAVKNTGGANPVANGTWNPASTEVLALAASKAVGPTGECIIVRVHLDYGSNINNASAARSVTLGVDGIMFDPSASAGNEYANNSLKDLDPDPAPGPCTNDGTDQAQYDITPRPNVTATAPAPFITKN